MCVDCKQNPAVTVASGQGDHVKVAFVAFPGEQAAESGLQDGDRSAPGLRCCCVSLDKVINSPLSPSLHEATKLDRLP